MDLGGAAFYGGDFEFKVSRLVHRSKPRNARLENHDDALFRGGALFGRGTRTVRRARSRPHTQAWRVGCLTSYRNDNRHFRPLSGAWEDDYWVCFRRPMYLLPRVLLSGDNIEGIYEHGHDYC